MPVSLVIRSESQVTFSKAGEAKKLTEGSMEGIKFGDIDVLVVNAGGALSAIGNTCTHRGCRLSSGRLDDNEVTCRCHGSVFNVKTGEVVHGPANKPEPVYKVKLENGEILIDI